jgi:hypothetical protein
MAKGQRRSGREGLPEGKWTATVAPFAQSKDRAFSGFRLVHTDAVTGDRVDAWIYEDDEQYASESTGIPSDLKPKQLWHLGRLEPRVQRARGGTKATLRYLAEQADQRGVWIMTEVMADNGDDATLIRVLKKYGDFEHVSDVDLWPRVLVRRPRKGRA